MALNDPTGNTTESDDQYDKLTSELTPDELLIRIKEWWRDDYPKCKLWHTEARTDFDFRAGNQWPEEDKKYMEEAQKRACLEFNQIDPVIDAVTGSEITNRQEVRYVPRQIGAAAVNEILTEAARWFRGECEAEHEESAAFADATTCGMGWTETRLDYEENPDGDPKVERIDPLEMVWDNAAKQANLIDSRRIMRVNTDLPVKDAKEKWPVGLDKQPIEDDSVYDAAWARSFDDDESPYVVHQAAEPLQHESDDEDREPRMVTIVQVQWFEKESFYRSMLINPQTGQQQMTELTEDQHNMAMQRAMELGQLYKGVKQARKIYYKAFVGGEVLEITKVEGPNGGKQAKNFSLLCITGKWDRNKGMFYGLVRPMRGPQTFANKWLSTAVEIMARGSKGGLNLEEGAVADIENFEENWSKPGANSYFRPGALSGGKVQPKPAVVFPNDFMQMTQFSIASIRDVTGVNTELLGMSAGGGSSNNDPQTASQEYQRRQSATIILAPLLDSLRRYRKLQGRMLLYYITEFLSDGRLVKITGQDGEQYVPLVRDPDVINYDVIVDDAPSAPSQKEMVWNFIVQMMPAIQAINPPPTVLLTLLEYSPLPASVIAKIKDGVAQASQNAPPPPPTPQELIMMQKKPDILALQATNQLKLTQIHAENQLELTQIHARNALDVEALHRKEQIRIWGKQQDALITKGHPLDGTPPPDPMQEGLAQAVRAGAELA